MIVAALVCTATGVVGFYDHLGYRDTQTVCLQKVIATT